MLPQKKFLFHLYFGISDLWLHTRHYCLGTIQIQSKRTLQDLEDFTSSFLKKKGKKVKIYKKNISTKNIVESSIYIAQGSMSQGFNTLQ